MFLQNHAMANSKYGQTLKFWILKIQDGGRPAAVIFTIKCVDLYNA